MRVRETRKGFVVILMVMIHIVSWVGATSRPIASSHVSFHPGLISLISSESNILDHYYVYIYISKGRHVDL